MQNPQPPLLLSFGAADPTGAGRIQADLAVAGSFGAHCLTVATRLLVRDSVNFESAFPIDAEWVIDQARCVLEDTQVQAFKVGDVGSVENAAAIAEIVSDYPDAALILAPPRLDHQQNSEASEDLQLAIAELLVPQTSVLVARRGDLEDFASGLGGGLALPPGEAGYQACLQRLLDTGCEFVLATDCEEHSFQIVHCLYGTGDAGQPQLLVRQSRDRLPLSYFGKSDTLSAAVAALLASGLDVPEAVSEAYDYLQQSMLAGYRLGMGKLMPDRFFWVRGDSEDEGGGDPDSLH
ncbi:MAG: hydroxymethylpyrimidine/phosphomethylpyrimidine kinase [Candidatus Protistobacter heckmanni]|nr:hydroxymethylpyrimidine/phosphomethylpyrimidine kinase [Candidatus Protistobacter heckmanni]